MIFAGDIVTLLLAGIVLVFIAGYSIARCRVTITNRQDSRAMFLFEGLRPIDSLASNMGAAFSLTYLGATAIYAHLYGLVFLLYLGLGFVLAGLIATTVVRHYKGPNRRDTNVLFFLLTAEYGQVNSKRIAYLYCLIYLALLVEEIAVSRVILNLIIPQSRLVAAVLLATLLLVIMTYLSWGGYRAVLISDYAQLRLLAIFLLALVFTLIAANPIQLDASSLVTAAASRKPMEVTLLGLVLFVPWLSAAPDFYARLNYKPNPSNRFSRQEFICMSLAFMFVVYGSVAVLGASLPDAFAQNQTPTGFAQAGIHIIGSSVSKIGTVVFFASIFCMMFTTIDTLLVTCLQCASLAGFKSRWTGRADSVMLLAATLAGFFLPADSISAIGLFIGGLLLLPSLPIIGIICSPLRQLLPRSQVYLYFSFAACVLTLLLTLEQLKTSFLDHHLIGLLVLIPTATCAMLAKTWELLRRNEK